MSAIGLGRRYDDVLLLDGVRTPWVDLSGALGKVSPTDLGIYVARALLARGHATTAVDSVLAGCVAQASFDAYLLPRHIGLYAGVDEAVPALGVQRVCGTGLELLRQGAEQLTSGEARRALCVAAESMTRTPIAASEHRDGFRLGAPLGFGDMLWEALEDPAAEVDMLGTAEALAALAPVHPGGVQTAGNSCAVVDGAAAVLLARGADVAPATALAWLRGVCCVGVAPGTMGRGPVPAIRGLLARCGLALAAIDRLEINAQGAQLLAVQRELGLDPARLNVHGGSLALGHPLAATGLRLVITLARQLRDEGLRYGVAAVCIGGGQGLAVLLENPEAV